MTDQLQTPPESRTALRPTNGPLATLSLSPAKAVAASLIGAAAGAATLARGEDGAAWVGIILSMALAWAAMIDVDRYRLPDLLTLPMIAGGLLYWAAHDAAQFPHHLIGAAAGYLALVVVAEIYRFMRKRDGLGRGDAKLLAAAGAWLGWKMLPFVVLGGSVGALLVIAILAITHGRTMAERPIPFGPFLAGAFLALWIARPWPVG